MKGKKKKQLNIRNRTENTEFAQVSFRDFRLVPYVQLFLPLLPNPESKI